MQLPLFYETLVAIRTSSTSGSYSRLADKIQVNFEVLKFVKYLTFCFNYYSSTNAFKLHEKFETYTFS